MYLALKETKTEHPPANSIWRHQKHDLDAGKLHIYRIICITEPLIIAEQRSFCCVASDVSAGAEYRIFQQSIGFVATTYTNLRPVDKTMVVYENVFNGNKWARSLDEFMSLRDGMPRFERLA